MIVIEHLNKVYRHAGSHTMALKDVSLTIPTGSVFGILGRSGAGKSTLIRCLNLLERPSAGRILLDGRDLTLLDKRELRLQRQRIGMIFQHFNLLHARNVADNVAVPLEIIGVPKAQRRARVAELLELVGLGNKADAFPSQLSGGQKQRVGIARALAANPRYLLCDEATSALDTETTASILALLQDINRQLGLTIVLITHELEVVKAICDGAALLDQGRVVETGPLAELLTRADSRLGRALLPYCDPGHNGEASVAELTFWDTTVASPVLSELLRQSGIGVTLLSGGVEAVAGKRIGRLRLGLHSPADGQALSDLLRSLNERGIAAEWV